MNQYFRHSSNRLKLQSHRIHLYAGPAIPLVQSCGGRCWHVRRQVCRPVRREGRISAEFSSFFFAVLAGINYALVIKNFKIRDILVLCAVTILLLMPAYNNCVGFGKIWSEDKLWPAVEVNENTGRVHAGCATFEYLSSKAYNNLDYIKTRENRVYVLSGEANIRNEVKNGTNMVFNVSEVEENTVLELPYIYYLGYNIEVRIDGQITKLEEFESDNGFVAINLGNITEGEIIVKYTGTTLMQISYIVSIVTFFVLVICLIVITVKNYKKHKNIKSDNIDNL